MKKTRIIAACGVLLLCVCSKPVHAEFDYYNQVTITKDTDNNGNTTYTNKANGKTYTVYANGTTVGDDTYKIKSKEALKKETVELDNYKEISICLPYGQSSISKLKIKKGKGVITAKISRSRVKKGFYLIFEKDTDGSYFYRDRLTGQKINMGTQKGMYVDFADYTVRVYGKKLGKAVLEYQVNDSNGKKVDKKKINITVQRNGSAIQSLTFGGKSLLIDYSKNANNKKYIYYNGTKSGTNFTKMKAGKLKVKLGSDYRLKGIYVLRSNGATNVPMNDKRYKGWERKSITKGLDLNGDGDFNDIIDGFEESKSTTIYYEKIRNGQKLVLNSDLLDEQNDYIDTSDNSTNTLNDTNNVRGTSIYIIYQDKRTGSYYWWRTSISRLVKKV